MSLSTERRRHRSRDPGEALGLLLSSRRGAVGVTAMVIASEEGLLVASEGWRRECELLAACAPFLGRGEPVPMSGLPRFEETIVQPFRRGGQTFYLALRGRARPGQLGSVMLSTLRSARRILGS